MLKKSFSTLLLVLFPLFVIAQSMTDSQVINFIQKENSKGTSQSQIVSKLLKQGVTTAQLQRIRKKYNKQQELIKQSQTEDYEKDAARLKEQSKGGIGIGRLEDKTQTSKYMQEELSLFKGDSLYFEEKSEKEIFGHNIFNNELLTFEPSSNMSAPANYRLGTGDNVVIEIWGASQQTIETIVSSEGTVTIEGVGPVRIAGMTVTQANSALRTSIGQYYKGSNIQLSVQDSRTINVQVLGEVKPLELIL